MSEIFLTTEDIIKKFSISKETLYWWLKNKPDFPKPLKFGRRNLWKKSEIEAYESYIESTRKPRE